MSALLTGQGRAMGIGLLSGGLDSILAVKVLQDQGLDLLGITFETPFFEAGPGLDAGRAAGIRMLVLDLSIKHLAMLRRPVYGFGSNMNPCIDCHALMLREAGRLMEQEGGDFLFTGEVLGQRPMSQRRDSLRSVEKLSGYVGRILRPLSARLLPPTIAEEQGLVDRERLLDIHGRSRKRQIELAAHYGITDYPQPGGGCLLTKEGFSQKLKHLLQTYPEAGPREVELLKWGRHFGLPHGGLLVIGRNRSDNEKLESLAKEEDLLLRVIDHPSPIGLIPEISGAAEEDLMLAGLILLTYSDAPPSQSVKVHWKRRRESGALLQTKAASREHFTAYQL